MITIWQQGDWAAECDDDSGRLTRVAWRGRGLLTPSPPSGAAGPAWGEFETHPVCGYDDCWPSLEVSAWPGRGAAVRDHGELCWRRWQLSASDQRLLCTASEPGDWTFTRTLSCPEGALRFDFTVTNDGPCPLVMGWAGHALVPPRAVLDLQLPPCEAVAQAWPPEPLGDVPAHVEGVWPFLREVEGQAVMLVLAHCATPSLTVALAGARWTIALHSVPRPSLGLWCNRGGYPPAPGLERQEFGIEWMLTPECLLQDAATNGNAITLAPRETFRWAVTWTIEET